MSKTPTVRVTTLKGWGFDFLEFEEKDGVVTKYWCKICCENPNVKKMAMGHRNLKHQGSFVDGSTTIKKNNVLLHIKSTGHQAALRAKDGKNKKVIENSFFRASNVSTDKMVKLFDIAYNVAYNELPFTKFRSLAQMEKKHGVDLGETYLNDKSCANFVMLINEQMCSDLMYIYNQSLQYFSISFDGSTDKASNEKEVIMMRFVSSDGEICEKVLSVTHLPYADATTITESINQTLERFDLDTSSMVAASADGASVNFGRINGVMTQLMTTCEHLIPLHCCAHKLELALKDAFKDTYFSKVIDEHLMRIHYLYRNSPKRLRELREIGRKIQKSVVKPPKSSGTRWIAHRLAATEAMMKNLPAITLHLEDQASGQRRDIRGDDLNRMKAYLKVLKSEKFEVYLNLYAVILRILARLSLSLQKTGKTVGEVKVEVLSCMTEISGLCNKPDVEIRQLGGQDPPEHQDENPDVGTAAHQSPGLNDMKDACKSIKDCLSVRFDNLVMSKELAAMAVFEPSNWPEDIDALHSYGADEVSLLVEHYRHSLTMNGCNIENILVQWNNLKLDASCNKYIVNNSSSFWSMIIRKKKDRFKDLLHLVAIILVIPVSTSNVERTFSAIKRILGDWRLLLKANTVEALLRITTEGVDPTEFDAAPAVERWRGITFRKPNSKSYGPRKATKADEYVDTQLDDSDIISESQTDSVAYAEDDDSDLDSVDE